MGRPATHLPAADVPGELLAAGGGPVALRHRDGRRIELPLTACPLTGADGRPAGTAPRRSCAAPSPHPPTPSSPSPTTS
ncbi:hypothetical protein ACIP4Y_31215 [Streptomyces sp. NPDC088810]|uniref:hypothetical protein n=1 Tax=Streptomyces sp. NPDC088810 TaxID=3365904 RepID=UPI0037F900BE